MQVDLKYDCTQLNFKTQQIAQFNFVCKDLQSIHRLSPHQAQPMISEINVKYLGIKYPLGRMIDQGAFGKIYKSSHKDVEFAIKIESMRCEHPQLVSECKLYHQLHSDYTAVDRGIPNVYACGVQDEYNFMVMDLMGPSLESLLNAEKSKKFSLKTVLMLIDQMITRIQYLHSRHFIHRDIKPDNFCMGLDKNKHKLYILDFGLARSYITKNGTHIPYRDGKNLTGTARYASINTHKGVEQSCRDDLESIGYLALYFLKGSLPWQGQKICNKYDKYERIKITKINTSTESLCKGCPSEFVTYLDIVKQLKFQEKPKYHELREIFKALFVKCGYKQDYQYDWTRPKQNGEGSRP